MSKRALGTLLVCISGTAFGTYSLFALRSVEAGFSPVPLLFYRFAIAAAILALIVVATRSALPKGRQLLAVIGLGGLYIGQSFTYLQCLKVSKDPIVASLLLYLYPAFVTVGSVFFLHEKLTRPKVFALVCAFAGSLLIIGPVGSIGWVTVGYGLATAMFYAAYLVAGKKVTRDIAPASTTLVIITTAAVAYGVGSIFIGFDLPRNPTDWAWPVGLAIVATVVAIGTLIMGLRWTTPVEASSLSALEPLVSAIIAVTLLGRQLQVGHVLGGVLVIIAVLVLARQAVDKPET